MQDSQTGMGKVVIASSLGTVLEWYDFILYGTAAAVVFNTLFFPNYDPVVGTILAFATYGVGFAARPVGGVVCGHFGDKIGRKPMLIFTLTIMGVATALMGLLPTYESVGILAPILLVTLRFAQGFATGGEWGAAASMIIEYAPPGRRGFYGSFLAVAFSIGVLLSTGIFALVRTMPEAAFLVWGWRIPFLLSLVLVVVGIFIRLRITESPVFEEVRDTNTESRMPVIQAITKYPRSVLVIIGTRLTENGIYYVFTVFALTYASQELGVEGAFLNGILIASVVAAVTAPIFGSLSDRIGRRPIYAIGAVFIGLFSLPFFWLIQTEVTAIIWLALTLAILAHTAMNAVRGSFFSELFGTRVRYSGVSVGNELSSVIAGGLTPFIATLLYAVSGRQLWPVVAVMIVYVLITLLSLRVAEETFRKDISEPEEEEKAAIAHEGTSSS